MTDPSPGRFAWILSPEEPDGGSRSAAPTEDEFAAACAWALGEWQVLPAVAPALLAWGGPALAAHPMAGRVRDRVIGLEVVARIQVQLCRRLVEALDAAGIPFCLFKGSALRFTAYHHPGLRCGKDLDVAVPARHVRRAESVVDRLGFVAAQWNPETRRFSPADPELKRRVEARHYELGFRVRRQTVGDLSPAQEAAIRRDLPHQVLWHQTSAGTLAFYVTVDLHHGLNLDVTVDEMVAAAERIAAAGTRVPVPPPEWSLFTLVFKLYWEGVHAYGKGGYQLADLARLVPSLGAEHVERFRRLMRRQRFEAGTHYVLRRLPADLRLPLSPELAALVDETRRCPEGDPVAHNDLGDMWPRIWGHR